MQLARNTVILANAWNPTIFTHDWLNGLGPWRDFRTEVSMAPISVVRSPEFALLCQPDRLQLAPTSSEQPLNELVNLAEAIINRLPQTPFSAVGHNFQAPPREFKDLGERRQFLRRLVQISEMPGLVAPDDSEIDTDIFIRKIVDGCQLTLNLISPPEQGGKIVVIVDFNCHHETGSRERTVEAIRRYETDLARCTEIAEGIC